MPGSRVTLQLYVYCFVRVIWLTFFMSAQNTLLCKCINSGQA